MKTYPLSFAQERLWFLDQLSPGSTAYVSVVAARVRGPLDVPVLRRVLRIVTESHEVLRTTVQASGDGARARIADVWSGGVICVDVTSVSVVDRSVLVERCLSAEAMRPFDLAIGPLIRARVVRLDALEHVLLLTLHHIITDGPSIRVLMDQVASLYDSLIHGRQAPLPSYRLQYGDYAEWQRAWLLSAAFKEQLSYWRHRLSGLPRLALQADEPRPSPSGAYRHVTTALSKELMCRVAACSRGHGVTVFMTLLAAWQVVLSRFADQRDIAVATAVTNRDRAELVPIIGVFVNTVVLRLDLSGAPSLSELLQRVRSMCLEAYVHQDLPFEKLVEVLNPVRVPGESPLARSLFTMQTAPPVAVRLAQLTWEPLRVYVNVARYELALSLWSTSESIDGVLEFDATLFSEDTAARLARQWQRVVTAFADDAACRPFEIDLLEPIERRQMLVKWNDTPLEVPAQCVTECFDARAEKMKDAVAVSDGCGHVTYAEVQRRAQALAQHLRGLGVTPEVRVGLCLSRRVEMVTAVLAILRAGGVYVPLDPTSPADRIAFTTTDAGIRVIVTEATYIERFAACDVTLLRLDEWEVVAGANGPPVTCELTAESAAYVLYTSGTSGRPKGVVATHGNLVNVLHGFQQMLRLSPDDRFVATTTLIFDIAALELFLPIVAGAQVLVARAGLDAADDIAAPAMSGTVRQATPTGWRMCLDRGWRPSPRTTILCGGEVLSADLARSLRSSGASLWNVYGPTETTVWSCAVAVDESLGSSIPLGRPIANTKVYVLDCWQRPVAVGVPGELYIGGAGVTRGYVNLPAFTASRFIPDSFSGAVGHRLYRTGDLVKWRSDGMLAFLGRTDEQVKVRGHRVELSEVEAQLRSYPGVAAAAAVVWSDPEPPSLVAYVVLRGITAVSEADLLSHLRDRLPPYMLPSAFVFLSELPLTSNGKVDRRRLPAASGNRRTGRLYAPPRTSTEEILSAIWATVLSINAVGRDDDFFEIGGHSLRAAQVVSQVRQAFGVELRLRQLFEKTTIGELAEIIDAATGAVASHECPPLRPVPAGPVPLSFAQEELFFVNQLEPDSAAYNVPLALRVRGPLSCAALRRSLRAVTRRHEVLRTRVSIGEEGARAIHDPTWRGRLTCVDLSGVQAQRREAFIAACAAAESARVFDLQTGPVLRARLLRVNAHDHVIVATMHHAVCDAWSIGLFVKELAAFYTALREDDEVAVLPPLATTYGEYAYWQRERHRGEARTGDLDYWRKRLAGVKQLTWPGAGHWERDARGDSSNTHVVLAPDLVDQIGALSRASHVTTFMVLLAAWHVVVSRYCGQRDVIIGTAAANRSVVELESLIGLFVNLLPLRMEHAETDTVAEFLEQVRNVCLDAYAHGEVPFERLVEEMRRQSPTDNGSPFVQATLTMQQAPDTFIRTPDLDVELLPMQPGAAKCDLSLSVHPGMDGIRASCTYLCAHFDATTVARLLGQWQHVLEQMACDSTQTLMDLDILSPEQRQQLDEWNTGESVLSSDSSIVELFDGQVSRAPDAVAVVGGDTQLTYAVLRERAGRVARILQRRGVGPESRVALYARPSAALLVGLLGVLKVGAAYVPLDIEHPLDRVSLMLADANADVVVTESRLAPRFLGNAVNIVTVDGWIDEADVNASVPIHRDNAAYVIYTSGSTGRPKGVVVTHGNLTNYTRSILNLLGPAREVPSRFATVSTISADLGNTCIYPALTSGGCLHMMDRAAATDAHLFARYMRDWQIDVLKIVPVHLQALLSAGGPAVLPRTHLFVGGDTLTSKLLIAIKASHTTCAVINHYGPTETTVGSVILSLHGYDWRTVTSRVPIGRPISNTQVCVLDDRQRAASIGAVGELYVGGQGVARGYVNRPAATAARFVPDPFGGLAGRRLYRTGDRVRWRSDGTLAFIDRIDGQVKIRGSRIEFGEIEACLRTHPAVRAAVVRTWADPADEPRLVAYIVSECDDVELLGPFLRARLPAAMIPHAFVALPVLPLTTNGKVDHRALPPPSRLPARGRRWVAPATPTEHALCGIWSRVLRIQQIGVDDNFFELGGDSIISLQMVAQARQAGVPLTVAQVFRWPRLGDLASHVPLPRLLTPPDADDQPPAGSVPLTPIQHWFFEQGVAEPWHWNQAVLLRIPRTVTLRVMAAVMTPWLAHHDAMWLRFTRTAGGEWTQAYTERAPRADDVLRFVDLREVPRAAQHVMWTTVAACVQASLDLTSGPVIRVVCMEGDERRLLIVAHHLVVDGVSWRVLLEDLQQLCEQFTTGRPFELSARTDSFGAWATALATSSPHFTSQWQFWQRLAMVTLHPLPRDGPGGPNTVGSLEMVRRQITPAETSALLHEVPRRSRSQVAEVIVTAIVWSLQNWIGSSGVLVDLEGHGRDELKFPLDVGRTVGWFTTHYPLYLATEGAGPGRALRAIKETLRQVPDHGIGYGVLKYLHPEGRVRLSTVPSPEIIVNYLGQFDQVTSAKDWALAPESAGSSRSPGGRRTHVLEIMSHVRDGRLWLTWGYSRSLHRAETIEALATDCLTRLRALIAHDDATDSLAPSDFPLSRLTQNDIDRIRGRLARNRVDTGAAPTN